MNLVPNGMTRRHFMSHMAATAATIPAIQFMQHLQVHAETVKKNQKACILMWMGGGPPTIDIWDLKPGSKNGGEFKPIKAAGTQISEHMPKTAAQFDVLNTVRSMSTREADHGRGRYFMHTAYVPNPTVVHPTFGSVVSHELGSKRKELEIPSFVSIGGDPGSPGFLGMGNAAFVVNTQGRIQNADTDGMDQNRFKNRLAMLGTIEDSFIASKRGEAPQAHKDVYKKAIDLMTSKQMEAFRIDKEDPKTIDRYTNAGAPTGMMGRGNNDFGRGLLMARRLVEAGVPFVEVGMGGWDLHANVFNTLKDRNLPMMDTAISALVTDLKERSMIKDVVVVWMGEFGRTPRINQDVGRDHWAASWSVMIGGGNLKGGLGVGQTDSDGLTCESKPYLPGNIWATACHALGIPTTTVHTSKRGRPMKIANGEAPIAELIG